MPRASHRPGGGKRARSAVVCVRARPGAWARGCETGCDDREFRETQPGGEISETNFRTSIRPARPKTRRRRQGERARPATPCHAVHAACAFQRW
eukprot:3785683-Prymnesium_polylepis.1